MVVVFLGDVPARMVTMEKHASSIIVLIHWSLLTLTLSINRNNIFAINTVHVITGHVRVSIRQRTEVQTAAGASVRTIAAIHSTKPSVNAFRAFQWHIVSAMRLKKEWVRTAR